MLDGRDQVSFRAERPLLAAVGATGIGRGLLAGQESACPAEEGLTNSFPRPFSRAL